jgi:hypothetical protein
MLPLFRLVASGLALLLLSGCLPESRNPIAPPTAAVADARVLGIWVAQIEDEVVYLHILQDKENIYDVVSVSHRPDGSGATDLYEGYIVKIGDRPFANLQPVGDTDAEGNEPAPAYFFASYELEGSDQLTVRYLAEQPLIDAIAAGKLTGEVTEDQLGRNILLTDEPARIAAFLAAADPATLFDQTMTFRRVPAP